MFKKENKAKKSIFFFTNFNSFGVFDNKPLELLVSNRVFLSCSNFTLCSYEESCVESDCVLHTCFRLTFFTLQVNSLYLKRMYFLYLILEPHRGIQEFYIYSSIFQKETVHIKEMLQVLVTIYPISDNIFMCWNLEVMIDKIFIE